MNKRNKNYFGLLIIPVIAVIFCAYQLAKISWESPQRADAAITSGSLNTVNTHPVGIYTGTQFKPDISMDDFGNSITVWARIDDLGTNENIYFRHVDIEGNLIGASETVVDSTVNNLKEIHPAVAMDQNGNYIIAWEGYNSGGTDGEILIRAYQADGTPVGSSSLVVNTTGGRGSGIETFPDVAIDYDGPSSGNDTRAIVTWRSSTDGGTTQDIYAQRIDVDFTQSTTLPTLVGSEIAVNASSGIANTKSSVAMNNLGEFMIVWNNTDIYYQTYAQNGTPIDSNLRITSQGFTDFGPATVATDKAPRPDLDDDTERRFIIAYTDEDASSYEISAETITCSDPTANGTDTDMTCSPSGLQIIANDNATYNERKNPYVSADYLGNFSIVWSELAGRNWNVNLQSFTYEGKRVNENTLILSATAAQWPSIHMNTDGFYAVASPAVSDVNQQTFITEIYKLENERLGHASSGNASTTVDTAVAPNGNIAVVYRDTSTADGETIRLTLRRFNPNNSPPDYTDLQLGTIIVSASGADNPSISFFKDTTGAGVGKFVVTWEDNSSGTKNVYYQIFNVDGSPDGSATAIRAGAFTQQLPRVQAGNYVSGELTVSRFAVQWHDSTNETMESAYYSGGSPTYNQLYTGCTTCVPGEVDIIPSTNDIIYVWEDNEFISKDDQIFMQEATAGTLVGSTVKIATPGIDNKDPAVAFVSTNSFAVTWSMFDSINVNVMAQIYSFDPTGPISEGAAFNVTQYSQAEERDFSSDISADTTLKNFLVIWGDTPLSGPEDMIWGQFFQYTGSGTNAADIFGPSFRVNSSIINDQILPAVGLNESGQAIVAWEGYSSSVDGTDFNAVAYQLLQSPLVQQEIQELAPLAQQEVEAGGQFLEVPTNITFPSVPLSIDDEVVQIVSVRDATYGGDIKYIEIQDATGADFTLTIQADDFFAAADGKPYIKNDEHFRVKNWDNDLTDIDPGDCDNATTPTDADVCFQTLESTVTPTAFTLNSSTQDHSFINTQQVLAEKTGTANNEIGRWRIFPEFEITIPPFIPPGTHSAEITFTLT